MRSPPKQKLVQVLDGKERFQNREITDYHLTRREALSVIKIEDNNAYGLEECKQISDSMHNNMRQFIIDNTGRAPEELITGEDIKKVENRYKKLTKEQLKAIEEFA